MGQTNGVSEGDPSSFRMMCLSASAHQAVRCDSMSLSKVQLVGNVNLATLAGTDHRADSKGATDISLMPPLSTHWLIHNFNLERAAALEGTMTAEGLDVQDRALIGRYPLICIMLSQPRVMATKMGGNGFNPSAFLLSKIDF